VYMQCDDALRGLDAVRRSQRARADARSALVAGSNSEHCEVGQLTYHSLGPLMAQNSCAPIDAASRAEAPPTASV